MKRRIGRIIEPFTVRRFISSVAAVKVATSARRFKPQHAGLKGPCSKRTHPDCVWITTCWTAADKRSKSSEIHCFYWNMNSKYKPEAHHLARLVHLESNGTPCLLPGLTPHLFKFNKKRPQVTCGATRRRRNDICAFPSSINTTLTNPLPVRLCWPIRSLGN